MKIVKPAVKVLTPLSLEMLKKIERCGRICYKSEKKITEGSAEKFVQMLLARRHESVLEHVALSVLVRCDRGVTHEMVRHRLASYSQESTRYCDYGKGGIKVIRPPFSNPQSEAVWFSAMLYAEAQYRKMLKMGETPSIARSVLPNSLKTEIVMSANLREWRHFFLLRTSVAAHPQIRQIAVPLLGYFQKRLPSVFSDIKPCTVTKGNALVTGL